VLIKDSVSPVRTALRKKKQLKKALISNEIEAFFFFIRWNE